MKKFDKIVIASDLDGTFFGKGARLIDRNLEAVKYFVENGGHFLVASGRFPWHIKRAFPEIGSYVNLPCVTCNGAVIYDYSKDELEIVKKIDSALVEEFIELLHESSEIAATRFSSRQIEFLYTPRDAKSERLEKELEGVRSDGSKHLIAEPSEWNDFEVYQAVVRSEKEDADRIREMIKVSFKDRLYVTQSGKSLLDVQSAGVNKGVTLRNVVSRYLGEGYTVYTVGDYINDIELHASADVSVCPENAHEDIKALCSLCLCSNEDGVIADLVEYLDKKAKNNEKI